VATVYCPSCANRKQKVVLLENLIQGWAIQKCVKCGAVVKASVDPRGHIDAHVLTPKRENIYTDR